jgi:hypothetical protein
MELQVVGVGFGRTGTNSLKVALEQLLGGRCHHMHEVFERPELVPLWMEAAAGRPDWDAIFDGDVATVDWPAAAFSMRESPSAWWHSARLTIFESLSIDGAPPEIQAWMDTVRGLIDSHGVDPGDEAGSEAAYARHIADVRATVPAHRLVEWTTGDGWEPLCHALGVPVPTEPFPHVNTTAEFRDRIGLGEPA